MRRLVVLVVLAGAAFGAVAAGQGPEVVDPCGDTESQVDGTPVDHPRSPDADLATVDVVDRADGGVDITFEVCADELPAAAEDAVELGWRVPTDEQCTHVAASVRIVDGVEQDGLVGTYTLTCVVQTACEPLPTGGFCTSSESTELGRVEVPVTRSGLRVTAELDAGALDGALSAWMGDGATMSRLRATATTLLGPGVGPGASTSGIDVRVALHDEASGRDHVLGEDG